MTLETVTLSDAMRIVVEPDCDAQNPRLDYRVGGLFYARPRARAFFLSPDGEPVDLEDAWDRLRDRYTVDEARNILERYLRAFHGARSAVVTGTVDGETVVAYATDADAERAGRDSAADMAETLRADIGAYRAWARGEAVVVSLERLHIYADVLDRSRTIGRWETVDSLVGVYLSDDYTAADVAREHFPDYPES